MEGKKKYFALILFLLLGLMIFTFANPTKEEEKSKNENSDGQQTEEIEKQDEEGTEQETNEEKISEEITLQGQEKQQAIEKKNNNGTTTIIQEDDSYDKARLAVEQAEKSFSSKDVTKAEQLVDQVKDEQKKKDLQQRVKNVKETIDAEELVAKLEKMVSESADKQGITNSRKFRTEKNVSQTVSELTESDKKKNLVERLQVLANILDDTNDPAISGIDDGAFVNKNVTLNVTDDTNTTIKIKKDQEEITRDPLTFTEEGAYEVTVTDEAFNEKTVTFTIDKTAPIIEVFGKKNKKLIEENGKYCYNSDVKVQITEVNPFTAVRTNKDKTQTYENQKQITIGSRYTNELVVTDAAGNSATAILVIDKTAPTATITYSTEEPTNQNVTATLTASEDIKEIEGWEKVDARTYKKVYEENITETLTIYDLAGNPGKVVVDIQNIDKEIPTVTNIKQEYETKQNGRIHLTVEFSEPVAVNGSSKYSTSYQGYYYRTKNITLNFADKAGNTNNITIAIDKTAPTATITYSTEEPTNQDVTVTLTADDDIKEIEGWEKVDARTYKKVYEENITETVTIYDLVGNPGKAVVDIQNIDKIAPTIQLNGDKSMTLEAGIDTYTELGATVIDNVDEKITFLEPIKINYSNKTIKGKKVDSVNTKVPGTYKIVYQAKDKAGNIGVDVSRADHDYVMRIVTVQDTKAPILKLNGDRITNVFLDDEYLEQGVTVTDNVDGEFTLLKVDLIHYYAPDGTRTKVDKVDTSKIGEYRIRYAYTDQAGNKGKEVYRQVFVKEK